MNALAHVRKQLAATPTKPYDDPRDEAARRLGLSDLIAEEVLLMEENGERRHD